MRRAVTVLAALALCFPVLGDTTFVRRAAVGGGSTDLLNGETFNAAGYDLASWSETVGAGATVDEDETVLCPAATGFSSQCLETSTGASSVKYWARYTLAAPQGGPVYCRAYMNIVNTTGLDTGESIVIAGNIYDIGAPDDTTSQIRVKLSNSAGVFSVLGRCRSVDFGTTTVTAGTTYLVEWYSDRSLATDTCDLKINGVQKGPQAASAAFSQDVVYISIGVGTSTVAQQSSIVWDSVACSSTGWVGGL